MDVVLFTASGGLGSFLPIQDSAQSSKSVRLALGLSFALFSLSILDVAPAQWLVFLDHDDGILSSRGNLTVTGAYEIILWIFCIGIVIVLPAGVGGRLFQMSTSSQDADDKKKRLWSQSPWWIRYSWQSFLLVLSICYRLFLSPLVNLVKRKLQTMYPSEPVLALSNSPDGSARLGGGSRHGPKTASGIMRISSKSVVLGGFCGVVTTLVILKTLGSLVISFPTQSSIHVLSTLVSWLCAAGLMISSVLNGFGSVSMPYSCLAGIFLEPIRPEVLARAELELRNTTKNMEGKLTDLHSDSITSLGDTSRRRSAATHAGKIAFADYNSDEISKRKRKLQNEIDFLETLIGELKEDIVEMKSAQEQAAKARTTLGRIRSYVGLVFSIVLLVRLYMAAKSVVQVRYGPQQERGDPITTALLWLAGHNFVSSKDYNTLSQGISLLLTAFLSMSQIRMFLRTASSVNRRIMLITRKCYCTPRRHGEESTYYSIHTRVLAALTGCYFLSCVVLTKMNLPAQYRSSFSAALGGMEYSICIPVVNLVFCISAGVSAMVVSLLVGIQRQNTKRYADEANVGAIEMC